MKEKQLSQQPSATIEPINPNQTLPSSQETIPSKEDNLHQPHKGAPTEQISVKPIEETTKTTTDPDLQAETEKAKKIAEAKAKAALLAKERAAKRKKETAAEERVPSPNQPALDRMIARIEQRLGKETIHSAAINRLSKHLPVIETLPEHYYTLASFLKDDGEMQFDYLAELHATDFIDHFEVYVQLCSSTYRHSVAVKVKVDRHNPVLPTLSSLWKGADWPECEVYDLLGITFTNHPNLKRLLLGEDWVGHPLRKDYEPYDGEV
ncbi:NADH-quinone oxidoreductase subunit C [Bacillus testis]|uniref:NADH-quinone oxidoreductase subunit C n=1 Tax=Bacillus testis TaxID=1622072 RepID=UPI00067EB4B7|nr:NADH-quinone oxidoreductase subunit C [Bacillus testis]